jgi:hypothetical protein
MTNTIYLTYTHKNIGMFIGKYIHHLKISEMSFE